MVTRRWKSLNTSLSEYAVVLVPFRCSQYLLSCNWFPGIVPGCMPPYLPFRQTVPERSGSWTISRMKKSYQAKFLVLGKIRCSYWFPPVNSILRSNMKQLEPLHFIIITYKKCYVSVGRFSPFRVGLKTPISVNLKSPMHHVCY